MIQKINSEHEALVNSLINDGYLKTALIIEAFKRIDRRDFVLSEHNDEAYLNAPCRSVLDKQFLSP